MPWPGSSHDPGCPAQVLLVATNKVLFKTLGFPFVTLLSGMHFLSGAAFLEVASKPRFGLFTAASGYDKAKVLKLGLFGAISIVSLNQSLHVNSLGTFQLLKAAVLPVVMALSCLTGTPPNARESAAAGLVILGSLLSITSDVTLTALGLTVGLVAVVTTALYQLWSSSYQKGLGMSAIQLLHASSLPQGIMTVAASMVLEVDWLHHAGISSAPVAADSAHARGTALDLFTYRFTAMQVGVALATCVLAVILNWSAFAILGKTSAVTMQVANQAKAAAIISLDLLVFLPALPSDKLGMFALGALLCLGGALWYGLQKARPAAVPPG